MNRPLLRLFLSSVVLGLAGCADWAKHPAAETPAQAANTAYYFCGGCHGPPPVDHMNTMAPVIDGQKKGYLIIALKSYRDQSRRAPFMNGMAESLTDQDIENLAAYYSAAKFNR